MKHARIGVVAAMAACCSILYSSTAGAVCEGGLPLTGTRDDVLIIVNDNSVDSCEVATHYAQARGLGSKNIVHVRTPAGFFMDWTQFTILRDQIINHMQQQIREKDPAFVPIQCTDSPSPYYCRESMDQLRSRTPIRYIVTTRGVPARVFVDNSTLFQGWAPTSVDNYLKYWLINHFDSDVSFSSLSANRASAFGDGSGMRIVDPHNDRELIVGRLDGLNLQSANNLVDRAIAAEQKGIYGKLYGNYGHSLMDNMRLFNYSSNNYIYGDSTSSWRWQFGLFHETDPVCFDYTQTSNYLNYPFSAPAGKSPEQCSVRISKGYGSYNDTPPGVADSRSPLPSNALVYLGNLNGHATGYNDFSNFLNWRRDSTCANSLCSTAPDPDACRLASVDIFKEIDTRCIGVADGFIGYNFQSFPLSYLMAAPTGWSLPMDYGGTGDCYYTSCSHVGLPIARMDTGYDDSYSLWYYNPDQTSAPLCYTDSTLGASQSCPPDQKYILIEQTIFLSSQHTSGNTNPDRYRIRLHYTAEPLSQATMLTASTKIYHILQTSPANNMLLQPIPTTGSPGWSTAEAILTLNPSDFTGWDGRYSQFDVRISTDPSVPFTGAVGIDAVSVKQIDQNGNEISGELIQNGSFNQGHIQSQVGDFTNFLSRLNGTAFWGSLSHHESGGHSFERHPVDTLTYFLRGLPLGDAVWFAEAHNSGVLYGDSLYSPVAVRLQAAQYTKIGRQAALTGSAMNGSDTNHVTTQYMVEYCAGDDFFVCDQQQSWLATGISGRGGQRNVNLGNWDTTGLAPGIRTLRLSVTSTNNITGAQQTFSDYARVLLYDDFSDFDGDGLKDVEEIALGTNPLNPDSDGDGLTDYQEVKVYKTNPLNYDTDGDGWDDWSEIEYGRNPLIPEYSWKSIVNKTTWNEYDSLAKAVAEAVSGDTIRIKNGAVVAVDNLVLNKDITIDGGYDDGYWNKTGSMLSTIRGQVQTDNGTATLSDILIDYADTSSQVLTAGTATTTLTGTMPAGSTVTITAATNATVGLIALTTSTTWSCDISNLAPGDNIFAITITSPTGEQTTTTTTITYNPIVPAVPAMGPATVLLSAVLLLLITRRLRNGSTSDAGRQGPGSAP